MSLTPNAIRSYAVDRAPLQNVNLQLVEYRVVESVGMNGAKNTRVKILLSDGSLVAQAAATGSFSEAFARGDFPINCIVQIQESGINNLAGDKWILVVTGMVKIAEASHMIGSPQMIQTGVAGTQPYKQNAAAQQQSSSAPMASSAPPQQSSSSYSSSSSSSSSGPVVRAPATAVGGASGYGGSGHAPSPSYQPVASLNPYGSRWTIKVRVTNKGDVKTFNNARGPGKLFSADLLDEQGGEIRCTFFSGGVDRFYDLLSVGGVYFMSGGRLKVANKQYTSIRHEYEIQFDEKAVINPAPPEEAARIARVQYNLVKLDKLEAIAPNTTVDVMGVVTSAGQQADFTSKAGKAMTKRDVKLADDTNTEVSLTLWGDRSSTVINDGDVLAVKGAKLGDYGGRSLSAWASTLVDVNPDHAAAGGLRAWYASNGGAGVRSISEARGGGAGGGGAGGGEGGPLSRIELRHNVAALRDEGLAQAQVAQGGGSLLVIKASLMQIRNDPDKLWYPACPIKNGDRTCNKKVTDQGAGMWVCNNCNNLPGGPTWRYIMSGQLVDASGANFVTLFDNEAQAVLGRSANELHDLVASAVASGNPPPPEFESAIKEPYFREMYFTVRLKMESVNGEPRIKGTVLKVRPLDYAKESRILLEAIKKYQPVLK